MTAPSCDKCEHGWRTVGDGYVERVVHRPTILDDPSSDPADRAIEMARYTVQINGARSTVYPCKDCQPSAFYRWAEGHFESDHDRAGCSVCSEMEGSKRSGRPRQEPAPTPHRRDIDL